MADVPEFDKDAMFERQAGHPIVKKAYVSPQLPKQIKEEDQDVTPDNTTD